MDELQYSLIRRHLLSSISLASSEKDAQEQAIANYIDQLLEWADFMEGLARQPIERLKGGTYVPKYVDPSRASVSIPEKYVRAVFWASAADKSTAARYRLEEAELVAVGRPASARLRQSRATVCDKLLREHRELKDLLEGDASGLFFEGKYQTEVTPYCKAKSAPVVVATQDEIRKTINELGAGMTTIGGAPTPTTAALTKQTFPFYARVDHEEERTETARFCLPKGAQVTSYSLRETTKNGRGTRVLRVEVLPDRPNCAAVVVYVRGNGVRRVGGMVVDHLGRGWLGLEVTLLSTGKQERG